VDKVHVRFLEIVEKVAHGRSYSVAARRSLSFDSICAETAQIIVISHSQVRVDSN
jgi:hypothetical protein